MFDQVGLTLRHKMAQKSMFRSEQSATNNFSTFMLPCQKGVMHFSILNSQPQVSDRFNVIPELCLWFLMSYWDDLIGQVHCD